jgi:predicted enzyme related to lactoylglutathione lyase
MPAALPAKPWDVGLSISATGATLKEAAHDVGGGRRVATVTDPDGTVLGLLQDP